MIRFLIKRFVQDYENVSDPEVRAAYGMLSGTLGLINNFVLFALKLTVGLVINSIAVISDAFNNLSDFCTSLIQIFGVKMSCKPPDKNHPQGHGRSEYIASLAVAFVIFSVGTRLFGSSFEKMIRMRERIAKVENYKASLRPYLQAFSASYLPKGYYQRYEAEQIRQQIQAVYDAGYEEWILWDHSSNYPRDAFLPKKSSSETEKNESDGQ
jgi:divalent metal cation (Fe/Co/Zn/Cd) transporter